MNFKCNIFICETCIITYAYNKSNRYKIASEIINLPQNIFCSAMNYSVFLFVVRHINFLYFKFYNTITSFSSFVITSPITVVAEYPASINSFVIFSIESKWQQISIPPEV